MWSVAQYSRAPWVETSFNAQATSGSSTVCWPCSAIPPDAVKIYTSDT